MYVKLAFAVAAHLDSEIMIMDEVLAVGDMAFQKKCLKKMREAADQEGRTVLYVSHNMNTIRQLCDRCIVLDHGCVVFNGGVEEAIAAYMGYDHNKYMNHIVINSNMRDPLWPNPSISIEEIALDNKDGFISSGDSLSFEVKTRNHSGIDSEIYLRVMIKTGTGEPISMSATAKMLLLRSGEENTSRYRLNLSQISPGTYYLSFVLYEIGEYGADKNVDVLRDICPITIIATPGYNHGMAWNTQWWGHFSVGDLISE